MKNIKVGYKLAIGFGAVLVLTLVVAFMGSSALDNTIERSDKSQAASRLLEIASEIRDAEGRFEQSSDTTQLQRMDQQVAQLKQLVVDSRPLFTLPADIDRLKTISDSADAFSQQAHAYEAAVNGKKDTRASWIQAGNAGDELIAKVDVALNGTPEQPVTHYNDEATATALRAVELAKQNRLIRYHVRGYLMTETDKDFQKVNDQFKSFVGVANTLAGELSGELAEQVKQSVREAETYNATFNRMPPFVDAQRQANDAMEKAYEQIYQSARGIIDSQSAQRASEASFWKTLMLVVAVVAMALGALIGLLITRQIANPLKQAVSIAGAIGDGDMSGRNAETRRDEFGALLDSLDRTRSNLRDTLGQVNGITTQLAAAAEQLSAVTVQTSSGVNTQRLETDQVATAMNEMTATAQEVARNAEEAASAAQEADRQAQQGNRVLKKALDQVDRLFNDVNQSADAMGKLNDDSASISTVLTVINGIAEQTNLLALNAAIEAARAGEAGRGFAVVADEVRGLAQRTQQSTAQIEELIGTLQKGSQVAVDMMGNSQSLASSTLDLTRDAVGELEGITRSVSAIQAMNLQIATASEEQTSVAEEINRSVLNVRDIADQSAAAAEQTAASSAELARLGGDLQQVIGRFRL